MADVTEAELVERVALMRRLGIRRLHMNAVEVELFDGPETQPSDEEDSAPALASSEATCNCPHDASQHDPVTGLCLEGCLPDVCATKRSGA